MADNSYSNFEIANLPALENSAASLANYNKKITTNINNLENIIKQIQSNWENDEGKDIESIINNLTASMKTLSETIQPVIGQYVETINKIVVDAQSLQNRGM